MLCMGGEKDCFQLKLSRRFHENTAHEMSEAFHNLT